MCSIYKLWFRHCFLFFLSEMANLIAKLHGLCKGFKKVHDGYWMQEDLSDEALIEQFKKDHMQHLPYQNAQSERILLNACLVNLEDFSQTLISSSSPIRIRPMINLFKIRSSATLFEMIQIRSKYLLDIGQAVTWWRLFLDTLPALPDQTAIKLIKDYSGPPNLVYHLTCVKMIQSGVKLEFPMSNLEELSIAEICFLLKAMLTEEPSDKECPLHDFVTCQPKNLIKFNQETWLTEAKNCLIAKFQGLSINSWMTLAEGYTCDLDPSINWWDCAKDNPGEEVKQIPSTLQLLVGHYCHQLIKMLPELAPLLSAFASKYKKEDELGLSDLDMDEILDIMNNEFLEQWKIEAYVHHLQKNFFDEVMQSDKAAVLEQYPEYLLDSIHDIYDILETNMGQYELFLKILRLSDVHTIMEVLSKGAKKRGDEKCRQILEQELRSFVNRAVVGDKDFEKEWLILVFQDETYAVTTLVYEAVENPGKMELAVNLIKLLPNLNSSLILQLLEVKEEASNNEESIIQFVINLSQVHDEFAQSAYDKFVVDINNERKCLKSMKILYGLRSLNINYAMQPFLDLDQAIINKGTRTVQDAEIQEMLQKFYDDDYVSYYDSSDPNIFHLPWIRPVQWSNLKVSSELIDTVAILLPTLSKDHQDYLLANLVQATKDSSTLLQVDALQSLVDLIEEFPENVKLQSCFSHVFAKLLAEENVDYDGLTKTISMLPTSCEARMLSLTKLKMMLELRG